MPDNLRQIVVAPNWWTRVPEVGVEVMHDGGGNEVIHVLYDSLHLPTTIGSRGVRTPSWYARGIEP